MNVIDNLSDHCCILLKEEKKIEFKYNSLHPEALPITFLNSKKQNNDIICITVQIQVVL